MPGVSGALLAINFGIYEKLLEVLTDFFNDWRKNLKFLLIIGGGGLLAIIFGSKLLLYLFNNCKFITMMFFIGLIISGSYNFAKTIRYSWKSLLILALVVFSFLLFNICTFGYGSFFNKSNNFTFFIGGFIEIFASIVPGISATSLLMLLGIYDVILEMIANIYNFDYVFNNIILYLNYGFGMIISIIINVYLINYLIKKYRNISYIVILGLSIASIIYLIIVTFKLKFTLIELIIGIMLFSVGMVLANLLSN